ncbi:MAG: hypothetical protein H0W64_04455 [Gammaproteobacteria bacterium]|nr:hypothetical protein [Gammaproteobacteria bacterium]
MLTQRSRHPRRTYYELLSLISIKDVSSYNVSKNYAAYKYLAIFLAPVKDTRIHNNSLVKWRDVVTYRIAELKNHITFNHFNFCEVSFRTKIEKEPDKIYLYVSYNSPKNFSIQDFELLANLIISKNEKITKAANIQAIADTKLDNAENIQISTNEKLINEANIQNEFLDNSEKEDPCNTLNCNHQTTATTENPLVLNIFENANLNDAQQPEKSKIEQFYDIKGQLSVPIPSQQNIEMILNKKLPERETKIAILSLLENYRLSTEVVDHGAKPNGMTEDQKLVFKAQIHMFNFFSAAQAQDEVQDCFPTPPQFT